MAATYNLADLADLSRTPSPDGNKIEEFKLAAEKLSAIFKANNITHAFFGGFALHLLGSTRIPADLDVVVDAKLTAVRTALESETGIALPSWKVNDGAIRIKVSIQRALQNGNHETIEVLADIFEADRGLGHGTKLGSTQKVTSKTKSIPVLNYTQLVNTKLKAWSDREEAKDAKDISFLVEKGGSKVEKSKLTKSLVDAFCDAEDCPEGLKSSQWATAKAGLK